MKLIEPEKAAYLNLLQSAKGAEWAELILKITTVEGIYTFGEFLHHPNSQIMLKVDEYKEIADLLKLFSYGTLNDCKNFELLNDGQKNKLKAVGEGEEGGKEMVKEETGKCSELQSFSSSGVRWVSVCFDTRMEV